MSVTPDVLNHIHEVKSTDILFPFLIWQKCEINGSLFATCEERTRLFLQVIGELEISKTSVRSFDTTFNYWIDFSPNCVGRQLFELSLDGQSTVELFFKQLISNFELEVHLCLLQHSLLSFIPFIRLWRVLSNILSVVFLELKLSARLLLLFHGIFILEVLIFINVGLISLLILHLNDLLSKFLDLLFVIDGCSMMGIDHHGALRCFSATFWVPTHLRIHSDYVILSISCEERVW